MLAEERFRRIIELVNKKNIVTVQEITHELGISESTVRRDLTALHNKGCLIKVHGGATAVEPDYDTKDDSVDVRRDLNCEEKMAIARYAAGLLQKGDFVYLDAGTTTGYMIDYIQERDVIFVTNGIEHARRLCAKGLKTFILGGELKPSTECVVGAEAVEELMRYNFTKGFFGTNGISVQGGYTTPDIHEGTVKAWAFKKCREKYVLSDASKFNKLCSFVFADFADAVILTEQLRDIRYRGKSNIVEVSAK